MDAVAWLQRLRGTTRLRAYLVGRLSFRAICLPLLVAAGAGANAQSPAQAPAPVHFSSSVLPGPAAPQPTVAIAAAGSALEEASGSPEGIRPFSRVGFDVQAGIGGAGGDIAVPLARTLNLRAGSNFFSYSTSVQEQGADISVSLRMQASHASVDWFPFGGKFRLSPLVVFANNNRLGANAIVPAGQTLNLNGSNYLSSANDPLQGSGSVDFRRVAPGLTLGLGNLLPRKLEGHTRHLSFPSETGFYYVGQPTLKVGFTGSACDPERPRVCGPVAGNPAFQQGLTQFEARNEKNLKYASFFPIFSAGVGYAF